MGPRMIMEMCMSGLAFYRHQEMLETRIMREKVRQLEDRNVKLRDYYEQVIHHFQEKQTKIERELEKTRKHYRGNELFPGSVEETEGETSIVTYSTRQKLRPMNNLDSDTGVMD